LGDVTGSISDGNPGIFCGRSFSHVDFGAGSEAP